MKNKMKFAFLGVFLLLVSGCDGTYTATINENLTIDESLSSSETRDVIGTYTNKIDQYGDTLIKDLKNSYPEYDMSSQLIYDNVIGKGAKTFSSFDSFSTDSMLKKVAFKTVKITTDGNLVTIQLKDFDEGNYLLVGDEIYGATYNNLTLEIKSAYQVESSNADEVDKVLNIYRWKYNYDKLPGEINMVINKSVFVTTPTNNKSYITMGIIGGIVVTILVTGIIVFNKAKQSNKI